MSEGDCLKIDGKEFFKFDQAIKCLSGIRCLEACGRHLHKDLSLPPSVGYIPKCLYMKSQSTVDLPLFRDPGLISFKKCIKFTSRHVAHVDGDIEFNKDGIWGSLIKITLDNKPEVLEEQAKSLWLLICNFNSSNTLFALLLPCVDADEHIDETSAIESSWQEMSSRCFLPFGLRDTRAEKLVSSSKSYANLNFPSWSAEHDEQICQLVCKIGTPNVREFIEGIKVSSGEGTKENLFSPNDEETWSPEGEVEDYIEIKIKPGIFIERFGLKLNRSRINYISGAMHVTGGSPGNMEKLMERPADTSYSYPGDEFWLLKKQKIYLKIIRVTFSISYQGEINISGLLLVPQKSEIDCFNFFNSNALIPYQRLHDIPPNLLCKRAILLKRVMSIYDSCFYYLHPNWNGRDSYGIIHRISKHLRHLLPLSELRKPFALAMLEKSEMKSDEDGAFYVTINRRILDKTSGTIDPKNSVFYQIFTQASANLKPFHYRFSKTKNQWWVCTFVNEKVSDNGGGFRDTLTNIAEELCPSIVSNKESVFSLFIPSPNQRNPDATDCDSYIPNGTCHEFAMYKWIGNIMGACLRTDENIAFSLPKFFWKMFVGHEVTWKDYDSVDQKEVTDLALMEKMDKAMFDAYFLDTRTWSHILSDGSSIELRKDGENMLLQYEDRLEYIRLVKEARLNEFKAQVDAMREGFINVVPLSLMHLYTLEELEEMICGKPVVSLEDLKNHVKFKHVSDQQRQMFWNVMEKLTDEERSQFLKFTSGRKRLPVNVEVQSDSDSCDILPTSSTCSSLFHLPQYSSFEKALTMIRYAINSCQMIDND